MSHLPPDTHRRLEPGVHPRCATGCREAMLCPPGRCVNAGGRVSDAPRGEREGGEAFTLSAPLVPLRVEVLGVQLRPRCTSEGPNADGAFVCDCRPGECPAFAHAKLTEPAPRFTLNSPRLDVLAAADLPVQAERDVVTLRGQVDVLRAWIREALGPLEVSEALLDDEDGGATMRQLIEAGRRLAKG